VFAIRREIKAKQTWLGKEKPHQKKNRRHSFHWHLDSDESGHSSFTFFKLCCGVLGEAGIEKQSISGGNLLSPLIILTPLRII
jgi:hypothetical protein